MQTKNGTLSEHTAHTKKDAKEHILIRVWDNRERDRNSIDELVKSTNEANPLELVHELVAEGILIIKNGKVLFTEQGEKYAENIIRRHRLAEFLLSEVLAVDDKSARSQVCEFEHILTAASVHFSDIRYIVRTGCRFHEGNAVQRLKEMLVPLFDRSST